MTDLVVGDDGLARCGWAARPEVYRHYHDTEWGVPMRDETALFERITLEAFQSGLSWLTILRKRPAFRRAFLGFDAEAVAEFTHADVARLLGDADIVRNRRKIEATIANAAATLTLRSTGGLGDLMWSFAPKPAARPATLRDVPAVTPSSKALAAALKGHGFTFIGPTTAYAAMQAIGLVDDHLQGCHVPPRAGC